MQLSSDLRDRIQKIQHEGEEREAMQRAAERKLPYINLFSAPVQVDALKFISEERARKLNVAIFEIKRPVAGLAVWDPKAEGVQELIKELEAQGFSVKLFTASLRGLEYVWNFYQYIPKESSHITGRVNIEKTEIERLSKILQGISTVSAAFAKIDFDTVSVTEFLEMVFSGAIANRASDIHFEVEEQAAKLRYRIDGILHDIFRKLPFLFYRKVISRVKLLAGVKINIQDRPQDGRFTIGFAAKEIEIRAAIAPTEFGETVVLRILDPDIIHISLSDLGLRADDLTIVQAQLEEPNGMVLNTGPTGSGKTTTLYAFLQAKHNPEIEIITIEDPIEYHLPDIEQTQVDEEAQYTFANGLRSIMRQDPDVILVGEIRDQDTAEIALQAALTGHLVFSTIHANDAAGAIPRLLDLGVRPSSIGPALNLIIAQRLVRRLCDTCKIARTPSRSEGQAYAAFLDRLPARVDRTPFQAIKTFDAKGCDKCSGLGYKGRVGIFELFVIEEAIEDSILKGVGESEMRRYGVSHGMVLMQVDGILKAFQGITTFSEVEEATGKIKWESSRTDNKKEST